MKTNKQNTQITQRPRAVYYLRTARACDSDSQAAINAQRAACERKARELEVAIVDEYVDIGTGNEIEDRPALRAMLARLKSDPSISFVLAYDYARLARNVDVYRKIIRALDAAGVDLVIIQEPGGPHVHKFMQTLTVAMADLAAQHRRETGRVRKVTP